MRKQVTWMIASLLLGCDASEDLDDKSANDISAQSADGFQSVIATTAKVTIPTANESRLIKDDPTASQLCAHCNVYCINHAGTSLRGPYDRGNHNCGMTLANAFCDSAFNWKGYSWFCR